MLLRGRILRPLHRIAETAIHAVHPSTGDSLEKQPKSKIGTLDMKKSTFITRVGLRNYKSIAACDVELRPLTFLVGPNGAGKSNFLDSLRFVADALDSSLDHAIRNRGGSDDIHCRSGDTSKAFQYSLGFHLVRRFHRTLRFSYR